MQHSFDISIAEKYGIYVAIFLNNLAFWIKNNQANEKHLHDGRYWTYNTMSAYTELFPYWTFKQIRTVIDKAYQLGILLIGNYNSTTYDRTQWYSLSDEGHRLMGFPICPKRQMEKPKKANGFDQKGKPIPDRKPDLKNIKIRKDKKEREESPPKKLCVSSATTVSENYTASDFHFTFAMDNEIDIDHEIKNFIDWHLAKGTLNKNWDNAFNLWLRRARKWKNEKFDHVHVIPKRTSIRDEFPGLNLKGISL